MQLLNHLIHSLNLLFISPTSAAEAAQMLARSVNYEIPALKRQIAKCLQLQQVRLDFFRYSFFQNHKTSLVQLYNTSIRSCLDNTE